MSPSSSQHIVSGNSKGPVCFTEGKITLALIEDYAESVRIYIHEYHEKVAANTIILKLIGGFECHEIRDAYSLEQESYNAMTLNKFLRA